MIKSYSVSKNEEQDHEAADSESNQMEQVDETAKHRLLLEEAPPALQLIKQDQNLIKPSLKRKRKYSDFANMHSALISDVSDCCPSSPIKKRRKTKQTQKEMNSQKQLPEPVRKAFEPIREAAIIEEQEELMDLMEQRINAFFEDNNVQVHTVQEAYDACLPKRRAFSLTTLIPNRERTCSFKRPPSLKLNIDCQK